MAAVSTTAKVVWVTLANMPGYSQAFVSYSGRLFRILYHRTTQMLAISFADKPADTVLASYRRSNIRVGDVILYGDGNPSNIVDMHRFLNEAFGTYRSIGVL